MEVDTPARTLNIEQESEGARWFSFPCTSRYCFHKSTTSFMALAQRRVQDECNLLNISCANAGASRRPLQSEAESGLPPYVPFSKTWQPTSRTDTPTLLSTASSDHNSGREATLLGQSGVGSRVSSPFAGLLSSEAFFSNLNCLVEFVNKAFPIPVEQKSLFPNLKHSRLLDCAENHYAGLINDWAPPAVPPSIFEIDRWS